MKLFVFGFFVLCLMKTLMASPNFQKFDDFSARTKNGISPIGKIEIDKLYRLKAIRVSKIPEELIWAYDDENGVWGYPNTDTTTCTDKNKKY